MYMGSWQINRPMVWHKIKKKYKSTVCFFILWIWMLIKYYLIYIFAYLSTSHVSFSWHVSLYNIWHNFDMHSVATKSDTICISQIWFVPQISLKNKHRKCAKSVQICVRACPWLITKPLWSDEPMQAPLKWLCAHAAVCLTFALFNGVNTLAVPFSTNESFWAFFLLRKESLHKKSDVWEDTLRIGAHAGDCGF